MTKPEFPELDPSSITPSEGEQKFSEDTSSPSFDLDVEQGAETDKSSKSAEHSYPELFPMPGMTVNADELLIPPLSQDRDLPLPGVSPDPASSAPVSQDFDASPNLADLFSVDNSSVQYDATSQGIQGENAAIDDLGGDDGVWDDDRVEASGSIDIPDSQPSMKKNSGFVEGDLGAASNAESLIIPTELGRGALLEQDESSPELEKSASPAKKSARKTRKSKSTLPSQNRFLRATQRWSKAASEHPVARHVTAFSGWPWVVALGVSGATTMSAFAWLAGLPPVPNCRNPASSWTDAGRLYCADQAARQKNPEALASALDMVGDWDKNDPLYDQVNKLSDDWSRSILDVAQRELDEGQLNEAIKLAEKVPKSSSYYDESRATIEDWQTNWKDGEKILAKARDAIQEQDWAVATDQLRQLVQLGGEHWQRRADKLISEMTIEQDAFRQLNVANDRAGYDTVADIQSAIQLATNIDSKRLARKKLMTYVDRWSDQLIDLADYYYEIGDYDTAIDAANAVPPGSKAEPEAIAYLQASRAQEASKDDTPFGYIEAIAYTSQVPASAKVLETAQEDIDQWEAQVQSWAQIEFAKIFTRFDQEAGYQIAIDHAALVETDNPNRVKAQSLIAQWDKQLNSVTDRQAIARASQLAEKTDLASVQAAIAEARRIKVESPLRVRAQTLIAEWEGSIEKREDQPILDKAIAQAEKGDLSAAIETAGTISSDRALYNDAQDQIDDWVAKIQIAEDDPILDQAAALARQGQLSAAIAKASEVGYGRALYYEAQDLIGRWIAERNRIEAARRPPEPEPYYDEPEPYYDEPEPEAQYVEPEPYYDPQPAQTYVPPDESYVDSASGAGISGGPERF